MKKTFPSCLLALSLTMSSCAHFGQERKIASEDRLVLSPLPLISFLESPNPEDRKAGRVLVVSHKNGLAFAIMRKAKEMNNEFALQAFKEPGRLREVVDLYADALVEYFPEKSKHNCMIDDKTWNRSLTAIIADQSIVVDKTLLKNALKAIWGRSKCKPSENQLFVASEIGKNYPRTQSSRVNTLPAAPQQAHEESLADKLSKTYSGRAFDSLAYIETSMKKELPLIQTEQGDLKLIGTLVSISYEDPSQSKDDSNYATKESVYGADVMLSFQTKNETFGIGAYAYQYGDTNDMDHPESHMANELYFLFQKRIKECFSINAEFRIGKVVNEKNSNYQVLRIYGSLKF